MGILGRLSQAVRRFRRDTRGVAAVEFALVLPIMLLLYVGTSEAGLLLSLDRRVQTVAGTMGDLVARANETISTCDIQDFFTAAAGIMEPYSNSTLQQVVTAVNVDKNGIAKVSWSVPFGGATARVKDAPFAMPAEMTNIAKNNMVIVAEASYTHTPITSLIYKSNITLRRENFFLPRFGGTITTSPAPSGGC